MCSYLIFFVNIRTSWVQKKLLFGKEIQAHETLDTGQMKFSFPCQFAGVGGILSKYHFQESLLF